MKENNHTRREFIAAGAGVIAAAGLGSLTHPAAAEPANSNGDKHKHTGKTANYAVCTLDLKWTRDRELRELVTAVIPILEQHGVKLVRSWIAAIGKYRKVVSVWEAADHAVFLQAVTDPKLVQHKARFENLGSATVDFATLLVKGPLKLSPEARRGGVIVTGTVTLQAGMAAQFAKILVDSFSTMGSHGVILEASYHTQIGNRNRILDVWWAPDANAVYSALSDPVLDAPAEDLDYSATMAGELVEVNTELTFS